MSRPALIAILLGAGLSAQIAPGPQPVLVTAPSEVTLPIPPGVGGIVAKRIVRFDPDGDWLHDLAIQWSSGHVTFCCAPEVLGAFCNMPTAGATGITRIPGGLMPSSALGDGLLVANGTNLTLFGYDGVHEVGGQPATGFVPLPFTVPQAWQQVVRVEAFHHGATCWLLGLGADLRTVRIGIWTGTSIANVAEVVAATTVQQLVMLDLAGDGTAEVVGARTNSGLEVWTTNGALARAPVAAPTDGPFGALTTYRDGASRRFAWVAQEGSHWLLRTVGLDSMETITISSPTVMPNRFMPLSLSAMQVNNSNVDALVLSQSTLLSPYSSPWQIVLTKDPAVANSLYEPGCAFQVTGMTYGTDVCGAVVEDITNDGKADFVTVLAEPRCVRIRTAIPTLVNNVMPGGVQSGAPGDSDPAGWLTQNCDSEIVNGSAFDNQLLLKVLVPATYQGTEMQAVGWTQFVNNPAGPTYGAEPIGSPCSNTFYQLSTSPGLHPTLQVPLQVPPNGAAWSMSHVRYFLLRFVTRSPQTSKITWSSPALVVAFVMKWTGGAPTADDLNYLTSISDPPFPVPTIVVTGAQRNPGLILKPARIRPPSSTLVPPTTGLGAAGTFASQW